MRAALPPIVAAGAVAAAVVCLAAFAPHASRPADALSGVWEAVRVNRGALPSNDQVVGKDGFTHAIRFHGMVLRLSPNGRFQAALRYRQAILSKGERIDAVPQQNDTWVGAYTLTGTHVRFVPERHANQRVEPFEGDVMGRRITVTFDYEIVTRKHYVLDFDRNDKIF